MSTRVLICISVVVLATAVAWAQDPNYHFQLADVVGGPGSNQEMAMTLDSAAGEVVGWAYGVAVPAGVAVVDVVQGSTTAAFNGGAGPHFHFVEIFDQGYIAHCVINTLGAEWLNPGVGYETERATLQLPTTPGEFSIDYTESLGTPPVSVAINVAGSGDLDPVTQGATLLVTDEFQRGDCNADGSINIADSIFVESYLFLSGATPGCLSACDTNDDGLINIADSIYSLNYLFVDGPPPAEPFDTCGADPTPDAISCFDPPTASCG